MGTDDNYNKQIHPKFNLNGQTHTIETLREQAYVFIKEGEPYQESVGSFLLEWLNDKKYVTARTSGSTGAPKAVKIKKRYMVNSATATAKRFKLTQGTTALLCLPATYIAGKMMVVRALVLGWHLDMTLPKANPLDNVYRRYDFCAMTPFQVDNSLSRMHLLSKLIVGGGAISPGLAQRLQEVATKVYETYGMTETVTHIATRRVNSKNQKESSTPFKALSKVSFKQDARGCLVIKAPEVSSDPVITNDLVELITYKKFLWLGRVDNVINSGGVKLYPEQIEQKMARFIEIPFFIAGVPDDALGECAALFVESSMPFTITKDSFAANTFKKYEFPKVVFTTTQFERTENGKIKRGATVRSLLRV